MSITGRHSHSPLIGVLDIGTSKICAALASRGPEGDLQLRGLGLQRSRGLKSGMVIDAVEAESAVRQAVGQAERMAGASLDRVAVSISAGRIRSNAFVAKASVEGGIVRGPDMGRVLAGGEAYLERSGRAVIQLTRSDWRLDGASGIADPTGLAGRNLSVNLHAVTADDGPIRNILGVVEKCHMVVDRLMAAPYASGMSVASEEERERGVLVVEMGAGVTSIAAFVDGRLVYVDAVPIGGNHVTYDIARELVTTVAEAERIKTLYGTMIKASSDATEMFAYPVIEDGSGETSGLHQTSKAHVREIVTPRIRALFDVLAERIALGGIEEFAQRRVVVAGGAGQLLGLDQAWAERFSGQVRIGRPPPISRMQSSMCGPAFATVMGLLQVEANPGREVRPGTGVAIGQGGYLDRIEHWLRESF